MTSWEIEAASCPIVATRLTCAHSACTARRLRSLSRSLSCARFCSVKSSTKAKPGVGAALAAAFLEQAIARGCRRFVVCGGAGALVPELVLGHVIVPTAAVRDEGTSYHYLAPAREVEAEPATVTAATSLLSERAVPHLTGKTWSTDGIYRETRARTARRRNEGCVVVEMEAAALFAVARFRKVSLAYLLYAGDSLAGDEWDHRDWQRHKRREELFWLSAATCLRI